MGLARAGADVAIGYRVDAQAARRTMASIERLGRRSFAVRADLTLGAECRRIVETAVRKLGRIDILINMASVYVQRPFDQLRAADWDAVMNIDLRAAFLCARAAAPHMRGNGGGRIINFSDWVAKSGRPRYLGYLPYYVAKSGIIGLTEALALELAPDNILVNAIAPGPILAPPATTDEESKAVEQATPLGRWGGEGEIAKVVAALLDSDFITGETIRVDGGRHIK